jgi:ABC-type Fe3+ transport system substrate-binding protein
MVLESRFREQHPEIKLQIQFQGSQELVNHYLEDRYDVDPTILIPANDILLQDLQERWQIQHQEDSPFYGSPVAIAETLLVAIAWPERGKVLFPNGSFDWDPVVMGMQKKNWQTLGGNPKWGSFDFLMTDPTRSNSGQLTLSLLLADQLKISTLPLASDLTAQADLFTLTRRSVYQPPRSTDTLLREFIARGPNDADVATVYESIALFRWSQSAASQGKLYQVYYPDPTIKTTSTAAIMRRDVSSAEAKAAQRFLDFLLDPEQQAVFVQHGFRPVTPSIDLVQVPNSPWNQRIPGAVVKPAIQVLAAPDQTLVTEIQRLWEEAR